MKKNLAKAITLGLMTATVFSFGGMNVAGATDVVAENKGDGAISYLGTGTGENYEMNLKGAFETKSCAATDAPIESSDDYFTDDTKASTEFIYHSGYLHAMNLNKLIKQDAVIEFEKVNINVSGNAGYVVRGLDTATLSSFESGNLSYGKNVTVNVGEYTQKNDLKAYFFTSDYVRRTFDTTSILVDDVKLNIKGDVKIESNISLANDVKGYKSIANNGVYGDHASVIKLEGNTYIDVKIPVGAEEAYSSEYGDGKVKCDALTASDKTQIYVNTDEAGNSLKKKVNLMGNLDVKGFRAYDGKDKGGTINVVLDGTESYWHGEEVREDDWLNGNTSPNAKLNVKVMNGAQWVPDLDVTKISAITLESSGMVDMAGYNSHVDKTGFAKELTIGKLTAPDKGDDFGVFRMDINAPGAIGDYSTSDTKNGGDFVYIKSGSGNVKLQPVVVGDPANFSYEQPVWFANAAEGVDFGTKTLKMEVADGKARIANPEILVDTDAGVAKYNKDVADTKTDGTQNWYLVGIEQQPEPEPDPDPINPEPEPKPDPIKPENPDGKTPVKSYNSGFAMWRDDDTLLKRLGELRFTNDEGGVWVRTIGRKLEANNEFGFNNHAKTVQVGYDRKDVQKNGKGTWRKGIAVGHTWSESSFGTDGHGHNNYTDLTLYGTNIRKNDHYWDLVARVGKINSDYDTRLGDHADYDNWATSVSAEYGRKKKLNDAGWYVEPQAQLTYSYMWGDNFTSKKGMVVNQGNADSLVGRAGFILSKELESERKYPHRYYAKAFVMHEFLDGGNVAMTDSFGKPGYGSSNFKDTWYVVGVGANVDMGNQCHFYFDAERNFKASVKMPYRVEAGFRWEF